MVNCKVLHYFIYTVKTRIYRSHLTSIAYFFGSG